LYQNIYLPFYKKACFDFMNKKKSTNYLFYSTSVNLTPQKGYFFEIIVENDFYGIILRATTIIIRAWE